MDTKEREGSTAELTAAGQRPSMLRHNPMTDWLDRWERTRSLFEQRDALMIPVEEFTEDDHLVIRAEMPGIDPDKDVSITIEDNTLHINVQRSETRSDKDRHMYRTEMRYGAFSRVIPLAVDTKAEAISATYTDGVLTVRLPIDHERVEVKRIPISRG